MPPERYNSITVSDEVVVQLSVVMTEYNCESLADAVETASTIVLERDEAECPDS